MLSDWCVTSRQASFFPTPDHLSASIMALYLQIEKDRNWERLKCKLYVGKREECIYTQKKAGKHSVRAIYAQTKAQKCTST